MGRVKGRKAWLIAGLIGPAWLGTAVHVSAAVRVPRAVLEQQLREEFAQVGNAVRQRLDREAAGDFVGARIAARSAEQHRYRFLDIKRELDRLPSPGGPSPSVEAVRSPFSPDLPLLAVPVARMDPELWVKADPRATQTPEASHPAWDMYRPRASAITPTLDDSEEQRVSSDSSAPKAIGEHLGDMYRNDRVLRPLGEREIAAPDGSSAPPGRDEPIRPFLVYRDSRR
jgi:hypothetical protein